MLGNKGVTLTELIVSTILIGIVMLGVVSFSMTIKNLQESSTQTGLQTMQVTAALRYLTRDIMLAVGEESNRGIITYQNGLNQSICLRHDLNNPVTIGDYSDDTWYCYYHGTSYDIHRYEDVDSDVVPCTGGTLCANNSVNNIDILEDSQNEFFNVIEDADGRLESVEIMLVSGSNNIVTSVNPINHGR